MIGLARDRFNPEDKRPTTDREAYLVLLHYSPDFDREPACKLARETYLHLHRTPYQFAIRLYDTDIVVFRGDGTILHTGGHRTALTKERMNRYLPSGYSVRSVGKLWRLFREGEFPNSWLFVDGMVIASDGGIHYPAGSIAGV